jgi:hypothetical protein
VCRGGCVSAGRGYRCGQAGVAVTVRTPGDVPGQRRQEVRKFKTFYPLLRRMVTWLMEQSVTHVTMEATGVYWKPVFHALCEAEQIEVLLVNARHAKNVPGPNGRHRQRVAGSAAAGLPAPALTAHSDRVTVSSARTLGDGPSRAVRRRTGRGCHRHGLARA